LFTNAPGRRPALRFVERGARSRAENAVDRLMKREDCPSVGFQS
jgi:hypothetical protein